MQAAEPWVDGATPGSGAQPHAWHASKSRNLARGVRSATRHSRAVRFLRIAIPAGAVLGLAAVALASWFNPLRILATLPNASTRLAISGTKIMMEAPRLTGYTRDGRGYEVTAQTAAQDVTKPDILELSGIRGKMIQQDTSAIDITAVSGIYDRKTELLTLQQHVVLNSSSGYEIHLSEASIDVPKHYIASNKPVEVRLTNGVITANRLEVIDDGDVIRFDGSVKFIMNPKPSDREASQ